MYLSEYLEKMGMSKKEFAVESDIPYQTIYQLIHGAEIKLTNVAKIERVTHRRVTAIDLYDEFIKS